MIQFLICKDWHAGCIECCGANKPVGGKNDWFLLQNENDCRCCINECRDSATCKSGRNDQGWYSSFAIGNNGNF